MQKTYYRPLDSRARTTTSTSFDFKFFRGILKIWTPRKASFYYFSLEKLALFPLVKEVTLSQSQNDKTTNINFDRDNLFSPLRHSC